MIPGPEILGTSLALSSLNGRAALSWLARKNRSKNLVNQRESDMLNWALIFLVVAIVAGLLGFSGVAGTASSIAWILFVVGLVVAIIFFLKGRSVT